MIGGLIFGFPEDGRQEIIDNYHFSKSIEVDTAYCQILTPYPKTDIRQYLLQEGLVTNRDCFSRYNGIWANIRTRHLDTHTLQFMVWYYRQQVLGWEKPSKAACKRHPVWTLIWVHVLQPLLRHLHRRSLGKYGWFGLYERHMKRIQRINRFEI